MTEQAIDVAVRARELHHTGPVADAHNDLLALVSERRRRGLDGGDWPDELRAGGIDLQVLAIFVDESRAPESALREVLLMVDALHEELADRPGARLCLSADDIDEASRNGELVVLLALEGAAALGPDLALLRLLHRVGLRMLSLTWNHRNAFADGCLEPRPAGLSELGEQLVVEAESLGIVVDVSHIAEPGFWDIATCTTRALLASHSACRALHDHPRNLSDEQLRTIAASGGVVGIALHPLLLGGQSCDRAVEHIAHALAVAGPDHVALGADFCAPLAEIMPGAEPALFATLEGLEGPRGLRTLTEALLRKGIDEADVRGVLGGNLTRFLREALVSRPHG